MGRGRQPIRAKTLMSTGRPHHFDYLLQVSETSLQTLTLYTSFHDLINVYNCRSGSNNPQGTKFWWHQTPLLTSVICCKLKKSLSRLILYTFFHDFIHVYSPGAGADNPLGDKIFMLTGTSCHFGHLLQVSNESLSSRFYTIFSWL